MVAVGEAYGEPIKSGKAWFGYFQEKDGRVEESVERVWVLVVHYDFKKAGLEKFERTGNAEDVERLRKTYQENRNCLFREIKSPKKEDFFDIISQRKKLVEIFSNAENSKEQIAEQIGAPQVFILYILSHGSEDGVIYTDHVDTLNKFIYFTRDEIYEQLAKIEEFDACVKFINFGPCRGEEDDPLFSSNQVQSSSTKETSCKVTKISFVQPFNRNLILFYSTVESKTAKRNDQAGSRIGTWFVQSWCDLLDSLQENTCLADGLTVVQNNIYRSSISNFIAKEGQTPEWNLYSQRILSLRPLKQPIFISGTPAHDSTGVICEVAVSNPRKHYFKWESDYGATLRYRKALIFHNYYDDLVKRLDEALTKRLDFQTTNQQISLKVINQFLQNSASIEFEDIGCYFIVFFCTIVAKTSEICILVDGESSYPIGQLIRSFKGPGNERFNGRPVLFFFINQNPLPKKDDLSKEKLNYCTTSTSYSNWLAFISIDKDASNKAIEIFEDSAIKDGTSSLQQLVSELLVPKNEDDPENSSLLFVSTLQYLLDFPDLPRCFVRPKFSHIRNHSHVPNMGMSLQCADNFNYRDLLHALSKSSENFWLVSSKPGLGKTTLVHEIAHDLRKLSDRKVILTELKHFFKFFCNANTCNLLSFLTEAMHISQEEVIDLLERKNILLIVDGLDEFGEHLRTKVARVLGEMVEMKIPFLVTTRPVVGDTIKKIFRCAESIELIEIKSLNSKQQLELIQRVTHKSNIDCKRLRNTLISNGMGELLENPSNLKILCQLENEENLYDACKKIVQHKVTLGMVSRESLNVNDPLAQKQVDERISLLQNVALHQLSQNGESKFGNQEALKINNTGIATMRANDISFVHQTLAEYLVCQKFIQNLLHSGDADVDIFNSNNLFVCLKFLDRYLAAKSSNSTQFHVKLKEYARLHMSEECVWSIIFACLDCLFNVLEPQIRDLVNIENFKLNYKYEASHFDHNHCSLRHQLDSLGLQSRSKSGLKSYIYGALLNAFLSGSINITTFLLSLESNDGGGLPQSSKFLCLEEAIHEHTFHSRHVIVEILAQFSNLATFSLFEAKGLVNVQNAGFAALRSACKNQQNGFEIGKFLLSRGVVPDLQMLKISIESGIFELTELIFNKMFDRNGKVNGLNILHIGLKINSLDFVVRMHKKNPHLILEHTAEGENALHLASRSSGQEICEWLVAKKVNFLELSQEKNNVLHTLVQDNLGILHVDVVSDEMKKLKYFSSLGVPVDATNQEGETPLYLALVSGKHDIAEHWIKSGADLHMKFQGRNLLHVCVESNNISNAKHLHEKCPTLIKELTTSGLTSLHLAARHSNLEMCKWLIKNGAGDIHALTKEGNNVLHELSTNKKFGSCMTNNFVYMGVQLNAENDSNQTPIQSAAESLNFEVFETLIDHGAEVQRCKIGNLNMLQHFVKISNMSLAKCVHAKNKELINEPTDEGETVLHLAARHSTVEMCEWLVENDADIHAVTREGHNLLHIAAHRNTLCGKQIAEYFLFLAVDMDQKNIKGETAIGLATANENKHVVQALSVSSDFQQLSERKYREFNLLLYYIKLNKLPSAIDCFMKKPELVTELGDGGRNALHIAAQFGSLKMCRWVVETGLVDVQALSWDGAIALHYAALNVMFGESLVHFFVKLGLDAYKKDKNNNIPLQVALLKENLKVIHVLLENDVVFEVEGEMFDPLCYCIYKNKLSSTKFIHEKERTLITNICHNGRNALHLAAENTDLNMCKWLVDNGVRPDARDEKNATALHYAGLNVLHVDVLVDFFCSLDLDVNCRDDNGDTPLHYALRAGNTIGAKVFLKKNADSQMKSGDDNLLQFCVIHNKLSSAKFLHEIDRSLIKEIGRNGKNVLHLAAQYADLEVCKWLVKNGLDVHAKDEEQGATALHWAGFNDSHGEEIVKYFISLGLKVNKRDKANDETPLHYALKKGCIKAANELLRNDANIQVEAGGVNLLNYCVLKNKLNSTAYVHERDKDMIKATCHNGKNALHLAAEHANLEMSKWLKEHGVDEQTRDTMVGATILHYAGYNKPYGVELTEYFVSLGLDVNQRDENNETPQHYALRKENIEVVKILRMKGADPKVKKGEDNLLHCAALENKLISAKFLHENDAELIEEIGQDGKNALHLAARYADLDMCKWFVESGVDVSAKDRDCRATALHYAASNKMHGEESVLFFISKGFDLNASNKCKETPLHFALQEENIKFAKALVNDGASLKVKKGGYNLMHCCALMNKLLSAKFVHENDSFLIREIGKDGKNVFHIAAQKGNLEMTNWLVENSVDVHAENETWGRTALPYASFSRSNGIEVIELHVSLGIDVDQRDDNDETPLHLALREEHVEIANVILESGADLNVVKKGNNLLHYCIYHNKLSSARSIHERDKELINERGENGKSIIHLAAEYADLYMCEWLVENGVDIFALDSEVEGSALHWAARNKLHGKELVEYFVSAGLGVNQRDKGDETPLHYALKVGNVERAKELLEYGADFRLQKGDENFLHFSVTCSQLTSTIFAYDKDPEMIKALGQNGKNALHLAAQHANLNICQWLVEKSIDVHAKSDRATALHFAAFNKLFGDEIVVYLLSLGLDVNKKDRYEKKPLQYALEHENYIVIKVLLNLNQIIEVKNEILDPLLYCIYINKLSSAKYVHEYVPDLIGKIRENGMNTLHFAAEHADLEMCKWLVDKGVDFNFLNEQWSGTLLHQVGFNKNHGVELVQYFDSMGMDLNQRDKFNDTPLHYALRAENIDVARKLFELGADSKVLKGQSNLLHYCAMKNKLGSAKLVFEKDAELIKELGQDGKKVLHFAAEYADRDMCTWLVDNGIDVRALDVKCGNSALHYVGFNEAHGVDLVQLFDSHGFSVNLRNMSDETPLHHALKTGNVGVAEALYKVGADLQLKKDGQNLLHYCVAHQKLKSAQFVHENDATLIKETDQNGKNALHLAAEFADPQMCRWLLKSGVNVHMKDVNSGRTPLSYLVSNPLYSDELVQCFLFHALRQ